MIKNFFFVLIFFAHQFAIAQIKPNTPYCMKGSDAHPVAYCADSTPCKTVIGPNGANLVCLNGTTNPPAGSTTISKTCWSNVSEYTCLQYSNECAQFSSNSSCSEPASRVCTTGPQSELLYSVNPKLGECSAYTHTFACTDARLPGSASYTSTASCETTGNQNNLNWSTTKTSSASDFIIAVTGQEFARQIATYGARDGSGIDNIFPGNPIGCRTGYGGLKNCCKSKEGGAVTNNSWAKSLGTSVGMSAFSNAAGYAVEKGSLMVYDSIMTNATMFLTPGVEDILARGVNNTLGSGGIGAFGLGTSADAAGGLFGSSSSSLLGNFGGVDLYFNPYALAAAVAIQVVMEVMSCNQDEKDLANARGQNLCHEIGSFCSTKIMVLGVMVGCAETTQQFCCFNGLLGKAVEEGAHAQLGLTWGTPKNPNCHGLTPAQLTSLDFNTPAMAQAMAPFKQQIMANYKNHTEPALTSGAVANDITGSANSSSRALCLQRKKFDPKTICN